MSVLHRLKKRAAAMAGRLANLDRRIERRCGRYVMCYHRVISQRQAADEWVHDSMWISPETFERQVRWMLTVGEIVPHDRVLDFETPNMRPLFSLTFDDGWRDNYQQAYPILRKYDVCATVFLATSCMDDGRLIWPEELALKTKQASETQPADHLTNAVRTLAPRPSDLPRDASIREGIEAAVEQLKVVSETDRLERIGRYIEALGVSDAPSTGYMLNWHEADEMARGGVIMGSHTHTHRICSESTPEQIEQELLTSRERIRTMLGRDADSFAYPNARYHGSEGRMLARCQYRSAFRIHNLPVTADVDRFFVPRLIANEATCGAPDYFKLRLLGIY